jgi:pimeloyl-ACP methyl ester carboxylesterase
VLLHGIGANLFCWRHLVPLLRRKYTVVALDLPGFGRSGKLGSARYGLDEQAERLEQFFRYLGIRKAVVVGNSMGGNIALWFSLRYPGLVAGTVVIAPATSPDLIPVSPERVLWLSRPVSAVLTRSMMKWAHRRTVSKKHLVDRKRVDATFETYGGKGEAVRSFLLATDAIRDARLSQRLRKLKGRVLILWGTKDKLVPRRVIKELEASLKRKESHAHEGGGHHLQEDEPEWVAEKIDAFLAAESPGRRW